MEKSFEKYLYYSKYSSLYALWQRYLSPVDNKKYKYFIDIWQHAEYVANDIANEEDLLIRLGRMVGFLPPANHLNSYYYICFIYTILLVKGDKRLEKWILYWTEVCNDEVKRIKMGGRSTSELFFDLMPAIKKYKRILIDINKGLVDIDHDLSIRSWDYGKSKKMNDEERANFINKLMDILSDVDINDVEVYEKSVEDEAITIIGSIMNGYDENVENVESEPVEEEKVDVILPKYNALNDELFICAMQKAIEKGWIEEIEDGRYKWVGFEEVKSNFNAALAYFIAKALKIKMELKPDKTLTIDSHKDINKKFPENYDIKKVFGVDIQSDQLVNALRAKNIQKWREVIDKFFDEET